VKVDVWDVVDEGKYMM